jgi:hypothetical protein
MKKTKKRINKGGRPIDVNAVKEIKKLIDENKLSFRDSLPVLQRKLGKKVDVKTAHRWYNYKLVGETIHS